MKLSKNTLGILKNMSQINGNLLLKPGNVLKTISASKSVFATATVEETFPTEFGIYDTNEFLSSLSIFQDPDIEFDKKFATITEGKSRIKFYSADASILTVMEKNFKFPDVDVEFELSSENLNTIQKTAGILKTTDLSFRGEDGKLIAHLGDKKNTSANTFDIELGDTDKEFCAFFNIDNLKFIPDAYKVELSSKKIARFTGSLVQYAVSMDFDSVF
jgi:hypothetical protein